MDLKKLIKLLYPPAWAIIILVPLCTAALIFTFINGLETFPLAYVIYVISFYTLSVVVLKCIKFFPKYYRRIRKSIYNHPLGNKYFTDPKFKTHINLYISLGVNLLYIGLNIVSGFMYHSAWFYILAFYYTILAAMRFLLVRFVNHVGIGKNPLKELYRSRLCGYILLLVNLALSGAVLMILYQNKGFKYNGILIYAAAAYTFYITTLAIINLIRYRKLGSPVMSTAKIINLAAALVSMLSLETAMFSAFGENLSAENQRLMIALTGGGVSIIIITMSVYSIVKNSKTIKNIKGGKKYGK